MRNFRSGNRNEYAYDAKDIAANQRTAGSVMPIVNATMSHINSCVGKDLDPDEVGFELEES